MILHELGTPSFAQFNIKHIVFGLTFLDVCNRVASVRRGRWNRDRSICPYRKVSSSHSFNSAYSSTGIFYIIKSHQILHISIVNWQVRLILIKTSLQTRFQIPYDGRSLEQSVGNVKTLVIDTEKCIYLNQVKSLSKCIQVC
jgi:hypothetical protein